MSASKSPHNDKAATAADLPAPSAREVPDNGGIPWATWPDATPCPYSDVYFSIACGNSHYHWAMHEGANFRFVPHTFWKTCVLKDDDVRKGRDPCRDLKVHLPDRASDFIFGPPIWLDKSETSVQFATNVHAVEESVSRRMPVINVYVISTNVEHERGLQYLFSKIPSRLFKLRSSDFWKVGLYPTIGVDRVAALRGARACFGLPALVIDGGTAMTFTASDADGELMGGDISVGLAWRIKALHRSMPKFGGAPLMQLEDVQAIINEDEPLECFSTDSKKSVLNCALMDIGYKCHHVVKTWLNEVGPATDPSDDCDMEEKEEKDERNIHSAKKTETNHHRAVTITGGDMDIIARLLEKVHGQLHSRIIEPEPSATEPTSVGEYTVERFRGAIHYGIAQVLVEKSNEQIAQQQGKESPETESLRNQILGLRVAMIESEFDDFRRGSVVSVSPGRTIDDDWFLVHHDDAEDRNYNIIQIFDGLKGYLKYGEIKKLEGGLTKAHRDSREKQKLEVHKSVQLLATATEKLEAHHAKAPHIPKAHAAKKRASLSSVKGSKTPPASTKKRSASVDGTKKADGGAKKHKPAHDANKKSSTVAVASKKTNAAASGAQEAHPVSSTNAASTEAANGTSEISTATSTPVASKKSKTNGVPASATSAPASGEIPPRIEKGQSLVGTRVAKYFEGGIFFGNVVEFLPRTVEEEDDLWKIHYDDDDKEEYDINDMNEAKDLYSLHVADDPHPE